MSLHGTLRDSGLHHQAGLDTPNSAPTDRPKTSRRLPVAKGFWLSIATVVSVILLWWTVTALQLISPLFLPAPQQVLHQLLVIASPQGFMDATLWQHLAASLGRILVALLAAVALGVPTGIAMGLSSTVRGVLDPLIEIYRPVPPLAYLPLMVIWFGIGETSKILLIYLAIFAPITLAAVAGYVVWHRLGSEPLAHWALATGRSYGL